MPLSAAQHQKIQDLILKLDQNVTADNDSLLGFALEILDQESGAYLLAMRLGDHDEHTEGKPRVFAEAGAGWDDHGLGNTVRAWMRDHHPNENTGLVDKLLDNLSNSVPGIAAPTADLLRAQLREDWIKIANRGTHKAPELTHDEIRQLAAGFQDGLVAMLQGLGQGDPTGERAFYVSYRAYVKAVVEQEPDPYGIVAHAVISLFKGLAGLVGQDVQEIADRQVQAIATRPKA